MVSVRWLRLPSRHPRGAPDGRLDRPRDVDAWLDVVHGLAQGRVREREALAAAAHRTRARLRGDPA